MHGMILAAGRGVRMGALTDHTPKPLVKVASRYLIEYALLALVAAGIRDIVINISYYAKSIMQVVGNGERYGAKVQYSYEPEALETGGGIFQALPLLGNNPFVVLSADVITDFPLGRLALFNSGLAHIILMDNPSWHPTGDFALCDGLVDPSGYPRLTYASLGLFHPQIFTDCKPGKFRLGPLISHYAAKQQVTGEHYHGLWQNIGTAEDIVSAEHVLK